MKQLIIAEKPNLARTICDGLKLNGEVFTNKGEYQESNNYVVIGLFGHLFKLYDVKDYLSEDIKWNEIKLPFLPQKMKYKLKPGKNGKVDPGVEKRFNTIKELIKREDITSIVNCGDSDREGEVIVRLVLSEAKNTKPVFRLWLPEQNPEEIAKQIKLMKSDSDYDNLANEGIARMYIDWLTGINYTIYASVKAQTLLRVGRVISTIVKIIDDRDKEIKNFIPKAYYQVVSKEKTNDIEIQLIYKDKFENKLDPTMNELIKKLNSGKSIVKSITGKEVESAPLKLFSQSLLQNYMNSKYNYSPSETLELTQKLYELGYVTYPRTPTTYLGENEKEKVKEIINKHNSVEIPLIFKDSKKIFDSNKIESHSAIIPTKIKPIEFENEKLSNCYNAILNRFKANFIEEKCINKITEVIIENSLIEFKLKGKINLVPGYLRLENEEKAETEELSKLPNIKEGDEINTNFKAVTKYTVAPKKYTVTTLNNFLKNPKWNIGDDEDKEIENILKGLEIGTEATRSQIIDNAISNEYIKLNNKTYEILPKGKYLIDTLEKLKINIDVDTSVHLSSELKKIYKNELQKEEVLEKVKNLITNTVKNDVQLEKKYEIEKEILGKCPICKNDIIETSKSYTCKNKNCKFTIWKETNYITKFLGKTLTKTMVKKLASGKSLEIKNIKSKSGNEYTGYFKLDISGKYINIKQIFNNKKD